MSKAVRQGRSRYSATAKITYDRNGRVRVNGKFASARQVGYVKGAATRTGVKPTIRRFRGPTRAEQVKRRNAGIKGGLTRKAHAAGGQFISERVRESIGSTVRSWRVPDATPAVLDLLCQRETVGEQPGHVLVYVVVEMIDREGETYFATVGRSHYRDASSPGVGQDLLADAGEIVDRYARSNDVAAIPAVHLIFEHLPY